MISRPIARELQSWLRNSRFWILVTALVISIDLGGLAQLTINSSTLQAIRLSQWYGFSGVGLLYVTLLISPAMHCIPWPQQAAWLRQARRALGVSSAYFALLHSFISFLDSLGGLGGVAYYTSVYRWSVGLGLLALVILIVMAATSFDAVIRILSIARWKAVQRLVYIAGVAILVHIVLIGTHYSGWTAIANTTAFLIVLLIGLEIRRFVNAKQI